MEPTTTPDPEPWYFVFAQSAAWWDRGEKVLLFRAACRNRQGELPLAFREYPYSLPIPGRLAGVKDAHGKRWKEHPATKAAAAHYGLVVGP